MRRERLQLWAKVTWGRVEVGASETPAAPPCPPRGLCHGLLFSVFQKLTLVTGDCPASRRGVGKQRKGRPALSDLPSRGGGLPGPGRDA